MKEPEQQIKTLYIPEMEHDACGIGFIAHLHGLASHDIVRDALTMLENMEHRGAVGSDPESGDGAGILIRIPDAFYREVCPFELPEFGNYGVGMVFFPNSEELSEVCREIFNAAISDLGFELLGYRKVPSNNTKLGAAPLSVEPQVEQVFVRPVGNWEGEELERRLFVLRKLGSRRIYKELPDAKEDFYIATFSYKTICYKGQFRTHQLRHYFPDLEDERVVSSLALIHSRFSTNTFPQWRLAQPFRYIAHNGEINTLRGNINWMIAKEQVMECDYFTDEELADIFPICDPTKSDSRNLDSLVEMLVMSGRSLPHALMMLIPEAWQENHEMKDPKRAFYEYHALLTEPWDGPASICFTDGILVGATLDRNGLRPSRYCVTKDGRVIMSSEAGALRIPENLILEKGRLQPGKMFLADMSKGRIVSDEELKSEICSQAPYREWLDKYQTSLEQLPLHSQETPASGTDTLLKRQLLFGISSEELKVVLAPMASTAHEAIGSMGTDTPLAVLSDLPQHFSHYFKQLFAQVSNPPIDPIRERMVMSLDTWIGGSNNILQASPDAAKVIAIRQPVLTNLELAKLRHIQHPDHKSATIDAIYRPGESLEVALDRLCKAAEAAVRDEADILIISDRGAGKDFAPIPALLATSAVHHHLLRERLRSNTDLIVETGDVRETHHFATIIGFGGVAINPYLVFDSFEEMQLEGLLPLSFTKEQLTNNYVKAINEGLLKIMSKMGISTLQSYHGAQIFEILGINKELVDRHFYGAVSRIEGLSYEEISREILARYERAFPKTVETTQKLDEGGIYQWKRTGEAHMFNPETIHLLQHSSRTNNYTLFKKYTEAINNQSQKAITLRSLLDFEYRDAIPLDEVESVENILQRFATGAMSFGSISHEAHTTLAIAMNRIGAKSNSGEGGEDSIRYEKKPNGDWERSAIKQVASARFGVTSYYLTNADELQIKIAQGAKPGEGGQLPGHKVDEWIGRVRHSTPGVGLISPPPHHDIYSIEDLAQLIFDLKNANRYARISVKLVSEAGVGTIAAGVAKAHADHILVSGYDGGTGASPISSIRHAGLPWELGLAEAHQTLVRNNLRSRVTLQVDGQIRTGRDMAIATLLGAEEWGVATAALVVGGCIMMRKCHLNTCPVGVATQDPELRKLFTGKPEDLVNFFTFLAMDFREIMAELGFRTVNEMVGQAGRLRLRNNIHHWKYKKLDLRGLLYQAPNKPDVGLYKQTAQDHGIETVLDRRLIEQAQPALSDLSPVFEHHDILNTNRAVGTMLSYEISRLYKAKGLEENMLHFKFTGSAGQSFGAFGAPGLRLELEGEANDYFGKGLSGAQLIVYPHHEAGFIPEDNMIIGNVALYGATAGEVFIRGKAGERFAVRNSGVSAVVEGVGDHGCEYMTGGCVVVLGPTGRNFAAGMSGGVAYVYDPNSLLVKNYNPELVDLEQPLSEDLSQIFRMLERHYAFSGSELALRFITNWEKLSLPFVKVMPRDYKAVLLKRAAKEISFPQSASHNEQRLKQAI